MITVPLPRLLDANLQEVRRLYPLSASITLTAQGTGEATLTLAAADPRPAMHQWVQLFTQHGSAGFYRVTGISNTYTGETQITLRHGIDTLSDSVYSAQAEEATFTVTQLLTNLLGYQTTRINGHAPWQLGTVEDTTTVKRAFNYDNLAELLHGLEEEKQNFYFTYDFSTTPWTLNFVRKPADVRCEFRLSRNIEGVTVTLDDSELCTQLLLSVNVLTTTTPTSTVDPDVDWPTLTVNDSTVRTYNNAAAQAEWGIVQKTASIDTQDDIVGQEFPDADAWAARFMADHSQPTLQIQITGEDLFEITGDTFDELTLAALCRVALPDHDALFNERVVTVTYPDVYGAPTSVTVSLANRLPRFSNSIAQAQKEAAKAGSAASAAKRSAGGGGGGTAKELESWAMIVKKTKESADVTGLTELSETGIILDAETGAKIYSLTQGFVSQYAELNVQSGEISSLVRTTDGLSSQVTQEAIRISLVVTDGANPQIKPAAIVASINNSGSTVAISADKILLDGDTLATKFTALSGSFNDLVSGNLSASKLVATAINVSNLEITNSLVYGGYGDLKGKIISGIGAAAEIGGQITIPTTYLDGTAGPPINFNIAATAKYQTDVAAAERTGWANAVGTVRAAYSGSASGIISSETQAIYLSSGGVLTVKAQAKRTADASSYTDAGTVIVYAPTYTLGPATITSNGIYNAPEYGYTGFSYVYVDVPTPAPDYSAVTTNIDSVSVTEYSATQVQVTVRASSMVGGSEISHTQSSFIRTVSS